MKPIVLINIVNVCLLIPMTIVFILLGCPAGFAFVYLAFFVYAVIINMHLLNTDDVVKELQRLDKQEYFKGEINVIIKAYETAVFYDKVFDKYDKTGSIWRTYKTLADRAEDNARRAIRWLKSYNYITETRQSTAYIVKLSNDSVYVMDKLNALNQLVIDVEDSAKDTDMSYVDDMLASLREVVENDKG